MKYRRDLRLVENIEKNIHHHSLTPKKIRFMTIFFYH
jgi:hypothetical protein